MLAKILTTATLPNAQKGISNLASLLKWLKLFIGLYFYVKVVF